MEDNLFDCQPQQTRQRVTTLQRKVGLPTSYYHDKSSSHTNWIVRHSKITREEIIQLIDKVNEVRPFSFNKTHDNNIAVLNKILNREVVVLKKVADINNDGKRLGKSDTYFHVLKNSNPTLFRYCLIHGKGKLAVGYNHYVLYADRLKSELVDWVEQFGKVNKLARYIAESGYGISNGFLYFIGSKQIGMITSITAGINRWTSFPDVTTSIKTVHKIKKMLSILDELDKI